MGPITWPQIVDFSVRFGPAIGVLVLILVLLLYENLVPKGRLLELRQIYEAQLKDKEEQIQRERERSDRAMAISEAQIDATRDLTTTTRGLKETVDTVLSRRTQR